MLSSKYSATLVCKYTTSIDNADYIEIFIRPNTTCSLSNWLKSTDALR